MTDTPSPDVDAVALEATIDPHAWAHAVKAELDGMPLWAFLADDPKALLVMRAVLREYLSALPKAAKAEGVNTSAERVKPDVADLLADPNAVHANMLRGTIAKPSISQIIHLYGHAALSAALTPDALAPMAWACVKCNSPRSVDPCPKCGTPLTKPADGWEWPTLPNIDRIRELAREVGYAIGVHGSLERDLDLIAAPWAESAVAPMALAEHIAAGLGGRVVDFETQDKPCGRWSCNIHTPDWTKMIDLSVMPPPAPIPAGEVAELVREWPGDDLDQLVSAIEAIEYAAHNDIKAPGQKTIWELARYALGIAPRIRADLLSRMAGEAKPYAHEFGRSNGDGTYSVVIQRGAAPPNAVPDWPIKPLYATPQAPK